MKKNNININLIKRGIRLIRKNAPCYIELTIAQSILNAVIPYISIYMSAEILTEITNERNLKRLLMLVVIAITAVLTVALVSAFLSYKTKVLKYQFNAMYNKMLSNKTYRLAYEQIEKSDVSELRASIDTNKITFGGGLSGVVSGVSKISGDVVSITTAMFLSLGMFFDKKSINLAPKEHNNVFFVLGLLIIIIVAVFVTSLLQKKMLKKNFEMFRSMSDFNKMSDYYNYNYLDDNKAAKEIRIFNQEKYVSHLYYQELLLPLWNSTKISLKLSERYQLVYAFFISFIGGLVYIYVALKTIARCFETGKIIQYYNAIMKLIMSFSSLVNDIYMLIDNNQYLELLFDYLDLPDEDNDKGEQISNMDSICIEFHNVSFKYSDKKDYALKNISFKIRKGEHIAIVGTNGSGKSTIIKLLCRFYKPTSGYITLNGVDINEYDYTEYKKILATVFQDFKLLSLSVGQNVSCEANPNTFKVLKSLDGVGLKTRMLFLPKKTDTYVYSDFDEHGVEFSGGEEQKIAIARSLYKNASIIILDEPTAALDPYSEERIYNDFMKIIKGKTAIFVTHRLSSCRSSDRILVLDAGQLVQQGHHSELIEVENGKYADLWYAQSDLYNKNISY